MSETIPLISIIVPVYNTEKYVGRCINSIQKQTYKNIEIVLVNDGSKDNSLEICNKYSQIDDRIIIVTQENRGLSSARNHGIDVSHGEFLMFVDSDDWIAPEMIEKMYKLMNDNDTDIAICDYVMSSSEKAVYISSKYDVKEFILNKTRAVTSLFVNGYYYSHAVAKIFKKEFWIKHRFPEGKKYEDLFTIPKVIFESNRVSYITYPGYYYYVRSGSLLNANYSIRDNDYLDAYKSNIDYFRQMLPEVVPYIESKWCEAYICTYNKIIRSKDNNSLDIYIRHYNESFNNYSKKCLRKSLRLQYFLMIKLMRYFPGLYHTMARVISALIKKS